MRILIMMLMYVALSGCATQARKDTTAYCSQEGLNKHPVVIQEKLVQMLKSVEVATGTVQCSTIGYGQFATTNCVPDTRIEFIPYTILARVDVNKDRRDRYVKKCADEKCMEKFKNIDCK
jgi:hypothetical protein